MTVGNAILLAALMLSVVLLYGFTQDRWPWAKLLFRDQWSWPKLSAFISVKPTHAQSEMSFGRALGFVALVVGLAVVALVSWYADYAGRQEIRFANEVTVGDPYHVVLQRQGVADRIIAQPDENGFIALYGNRRIFSFSPDSAVVGILFLGARAEDIPFTWPSRDGVTLGTQRSEVRASLGQPCREEVRENFTILSFATRDRDVRRLVHLQHGSGRVVGHGWLAGSCP